MKNFPHEAIAVIDEVLQVGRAKGHNECYWRTLSVSDHVAHAKAHLMDFIYGIVTDEDNLAHALCRLAMAVAVRDQEVKNAPL